MSQEQPEKATLYQSVMNTIGLGHKKPETTDLSETDKTSADFPSQALNDNSGAPGGGHLSAPIPTDLVSGAGTGAVPPLTDTNNYEAYGGDLNKTTAGIGGESRYGNDIYASGPQPLGGTAATTTTTTGDFGGAGKTVGFEDSTAGTNMTRSGSSSSSSSDEEEEGSEYGADGKPTTKEKLKKVTDKVKEKMCMGGPA